MIAMLIGFSALVVVAVMGVVWLCLRPMTVCLTFDDGVRSHLTLAGPMLEKYGWRGEFNVCTDFCESSPASLTEEKLEVLKMSKAASLRLGWDDVRELLRRGHEVYPHSCSHEMLGRLWKLGQTETVRHEVVDAAKAYAAHLGVWPRFFCCPHLDWTPEIRDLIHANKMEMINNGRPDIGRSNIKVVPLLCGLYHEGRRHVDLMFHGIVASEGGYNAFEKLEDFEAILKALKRLETKRKIRVISYSQGHHGFSVGSLWLDRLEWVLNKTRRVALRLWFGDHAPSNSWD